MTEIYLDGVNVKKTLRKIPLERDEADVINALFIAWEGYLSRQESGEFSVTKKEFDNIDLLNLNILITQTDERLTLTLVKEEWINYPTEED